MSRKILVSIDPYETRAAIVDNDHPIELFFEIKDSEKVVGCIFKGRVANVVPGTQSAFVDIGLNKDAFLALTGVESLCSSDDDDELKEIFKTPIQEMIKVGQEAIIQILKEPTPTKGPRSTMLLSIPGRYLVFTPTVDHIGLSRRISSDRERDRLRAIGKKFCPKGTGVIFRTASEGLEERELAGDMQMLLKIWQQIEKKVKHQPPRTIVHRDISLPLKLVRDFFSDDVEQFIIDSPEEHKNILEFCDFLTPLQRASLELYSGPVPLFEKYGVEKEIEQALETKVWLESGGYLYFEKTEALVSIDVNSGRFSGGVDLEETVFKVNMEAAKVIARQVRLRNLAGLIVIDFIDMENKKHRTQLIKTLKENFRGDRNRPNINEMSDLGLVQMTRRRTSHSLVEIMKMTCPCCLGTRMIFSPSTLGNRIRKQLVADANRFEAARFKVRAHKTVLEFLRGKDDWRLKELEDRIKRKVVLEAQNDDDFQTYKVEPML